MAGFVLSEGAKKREWDTRKSGVTTALKAGDGKTAYTIAGNPKGGSKKTKKKSRKRSSK